MLVFVEKKRSDLSSRVFIVHSVSIGVERSEIQNAYTERLKIVCKNVFRFTELPEKTRTKNVDILLADFNVFGELYERKIRYCCYLIILPLKEVDIVTI